MSISSSSSSKSHQHLSIEQRYAIIALDKHTDWTQRKIAESIGCDHGTVSRVLKKYREHGTVEDLSHIGHKPIIDISNKQENPITGVIRQHRDYTSSQIVCELGVAISARTIRRYRELLEFKPVHYRRRPLLTPAKQTERLYYCIDNMENDWRNIIFTDESMIILSNERRIVWKHRESPPPIKCVKQFKQSFMVWGGVWYEGRTELAIIDGTLDADKYQQILSKYLIEPGYTLELDVLQDQATPHTAESTDEFISEKGITMINNPRSSPEVNPIEKVWGLIKQQQGSQMPNSLEELKQLIIRLWNEIPQNTIKQFIRHNSTVVNEIIEAEGGTILEPTRHHHRPSA
jgi:transposase